jgi:hypothetical protein
MMANLFDENEAPEGEPLKIVVGDFVQWKKTSLAENRVVVERGEFEVIQDLDNSGADPRTHAEIMLNKIESLLQGRADKDVSSYSIQGRSIAKMSIVDLLQWRDYYRKEVSKERRDNAIALGKPTKTTMKVRFL